MLSILTIVSKIIQSQYNRFFNDTKELCPSLCPFFPPNALCSPVWLWLSQNQVFHQQALSFKPHIDLVLSMYKCDFSLLISKQGFKKSFEIALFSTVLQRRSFSSPQVLCLHTICQSSGATHYFIPATVVVEASVNLSLIFHFLLTLLLLHTGVVTGSPDSH